MLTKFLHTHARGSCLSSYLHTHLTTSTKHVSAAVADVRVGWGHCVERERWRCVGWAMVDGWGRKQPTFASRVAHTDKFAARTTACIVE